MDTTGGKTVSVYLAGDSTVCDELPDWVPQSGWGSKLGEFFADTVSVRNFALGGRSASSFIDEGHLDAVMTEIGKGDWLFVQFGHNDEKLSEGRYAHPRGAYRRFLKEYADRARMAGADPVFISSVQRRRFRRDGTFYGTHGEYPEAVRVCARDLGVPYVDLAGRSRALYESLGPEGTVPLFLYLKRGEEKNYPEGSADNTHFSRKGARVVASLVVEGIRELRLQLVEYLK